MPVCVAPWTTQVVNGLIATNPVNRVRRPKAVHQEALSLSPIEVTRLLANATSLRYGVVLRFILGTGLRRGEALAVRWSDVDLTRGEIKVKGSLVREDRRLSGGRAQVSPLPAGDLSAPGRC